MKNGKNLILIAIFAIAMAYLESAVVVYLRELYGIEDLLRDINFQPDTYTFIEIGREAATIVMLIAIAFFAGSTKPKRIGYFFLSFGIWDIFYYIWLYVFIQWPKSLFDWDVLFLIPLPWWGPVFAPVLISVLLISIGYLLIKEVNFKVTLFDWGVFYLSIILLLYTFVEDSIRIILGGNGILAEVRPSNFNWILFSTALLAWVLITFKVFRPTKKKNIQN